MQEDDKDWPMYRWAKEDGSLLTSYDHEVYAGKGVAGNISFFDFENPTTHVIME